MGFGSNLKKLREDRKISRKELAAKLQIPYTTLRGYETEEREPGNLFLVNLSHALNVSIDYLLGLSESPAIVKQSTPFSCSEINQIEKYRVLDERGKKIVDFVLDEEYERYLETPSVPIKIAALGGGVKTYLLTPKEAEIADRELSKLIEECKDDDLPY